MTMLRNILYLSFIAISSWSACLISCLFHERYLRTGNSRFGYGADFAFSPVLCLGILAAVVIATRKSWVIPGLWNRLTCITIGVAVLFVVPLLLGQF